MLSMELETSRCKAAFAVGSSQLPVSLLDVSNIGYFSTSTPRQKAT